MTSIPSILEEIIVEKVKEVEAKKKVFPVEAIEAMIAENQIASRGFYEALRKRVDLEKDSVIAEIKKASPSKGVIRENFNPKEIAVSYENAGATCLSVLTDEKFFQGSELYLDEAREATSLPVLRKDFIIDSYQVYESKAMGADCILLIASCLSTEQMKEFITIAYDLGMDVLVEVHNLEELDKVAGLPIRMVGINNRNLNTFELDLETTFKLLPQIPAEILVVTESGIKTRDDISVMNGAGIYAFLVGESLMSEESPGEKLNEMFNV